MPPFVIFLILAGLNTGVAKLQHDAIQISAPQIQVVYSTRLYRYAPVVFFTGTLPDGFEYEVEYSAPVGKRFFRTVSTVQPFDFAYAAPCLVRVRLSSPVVKGSWSKAVQVDELITQTGVLIF